VWTHPNCLIRKLGQNFDAIFGAHFLDTLAPAQTQEPPQILHQIFPS